MKNLRRVKTSSKLLRQYEPLMDKEAEAQRQATIKQTLATRRETKRITSRMNVLCFGGVQ